jgi:hypothetical protein
MERQIPGRVWAAFAVAPIAAVAAFVACAATALVVGGAPAERVFAGAWSASLLFAFFGLPVAYFVAFALGLPLYLALTERGPVTAPKILVAATLAGTVVMPLLWHLLFGLPVAWQTPLVGAIMGAAAGLAFARIALGTFASRPSI